MKVWMKNTIAAIAIVLAGLIVGEAQITVPHVFTTSVPVSQLNADLAALGAGALNRNGGTITGNIGVDSGVTIDGVDIGATLGGTGDPSFDTVTVTGTGAGALDVAGGINAGSGNVGIVDTTGKIPALSSTYLASLSASNLTIGALTLPAYIYTSTTSYTPTWSGGAPSIGNGTLTSRYQRSGDRVDYQIHLVGGSTTTWGTGATWTFSLPLSAVSSVVYYVGTASAVDTGTAYYTGTVVIAPGDNTLFVHPSTAASATGFHATNPITWATGDELRINISYITTP